MRFSTDVVKQSTIMLRNPHSTILLTTFAAQVASPLLAGFITWMPSSYLVGAELGSNPGVIVLVLKNMDMWKDYLIYFQRNLTARQAPCLASLAWDRIDQRVSAGTHRHALKYPRPSSKITSSDLTPRPHFAQLGTKSSLPSSDLPYAYIAQDAA